MIPLIASGVSSLTLCAPGTVFTGASLTAVIDSVVVARLLASRAVVGGELDHPAGGVGVLRGVVVGHRPQHLLVVGHRVAPPESVKMPVPLS